jgi:integrase
MNSTISAHIKIIKRIMRLAKRAKLISTNDFSDYENIKVKYKKPDFLTEDDLVAFTDAWNIIDKPIIKIPGAYFLLSCYTGFRIGDALRFNYKTMVKHGKVFLDAEKNLNRSGVPLFPALNDVIDFIKDNPCNYEQTTVRRSVKIIAAVAGIDKHIKFHTSRHTFCSRMLQLGFTIPEVADMAGDSVATISKTYAHVDWQNLKDKVKRLLG